MSGKPTDKTELKCPEKSTKHRVPAAGTAHEKHRDGCRAGVLLWGLLGHSAPLPPLQGPRATHGWLRLSFANLGPLPCPTTAAFYSCFPVGATVQGLGRYVVREPGRKFSLPTAPPLLPPCHPPASRVAVCWGSWWKGRDGRRREGSFGLNSCCIFGCRWIPCLDAGRTGLPSRARWLQVSWVQVWWLCWCLLAVLVSPVLPRAAAVCRLPDVCWGMGQKPRRGRASSTTQRERG